MSSFNPSIPQPTDELSDSQPELLGNNQQLDISFGIDHYTFSNQTSNNGKHNTVTTPIVIGGVHPVTAVDEPRLYAMRDSTPLGVIQYSRGPSNAVPTPLTSLQSTSAAIVLATTTSTTVLDFAGLSRAFAVLYAYDNLSPTTGKICAFIIWTGSAGFINVLTSGANNLGATFTGGGSSVLTLTNNSIAAMNVYWTLQLNRLS